MTDPAVPNSLLQAQKETLAQQQHQRADQLAVERQEAVPIAATAAMQEQEFWTWLSSGAAATSVAHLLVFSDPELPATTTVAPIMSDAMFSDVACWADVAWWAVDGTAH